MNNWPTSEEELGAVAEKIAKLLNAPFAAVGVLAAESVTESKVGFSFLRGVPSGSSRDPSILREVLKQNFNPQMSEGNFFQPKQIQVGVDHPLTATLGEHYHFSWVGIQGEGQKYMGWVVVATEKAMGSKEELLLMSVGQKLGQLASNDEFRRQIQLRSQFLSIASHELKTPLTAIYGVLQLQERMYRLQKDPEGLQPERQRTYLKMVIRQVERLNELIDGLLDVSRIQNNRFLVEPIETDVAELLSDTVQNRLTVIAEEAGVRIQLESPPNLKAFVDPVRMEEVITNLAMNAIRFSPEGGTIWLKLTDESGAFRLVVRDQGPNVSSEDRERIFQPFERAQRTGRLGGLGLGLFISRQIAQLHGGNVTLVESIPGKGNVLEAFFPARSQTQVLAG